MFAHRPQSSGAARRAEERARQRPAEPRADRRLDAGRRAGRAAAATTCPISTRCSSPIPAPRRVEAAIKFARGATGRPGIVYCDHAFHGLTYGALSLNGDEISATASSRCCRDCTAVPFNDLAALEQRAVVARGRGLHRRADPGQGRQHARPTTICQAPPSSAAATARCSSPTKSRPASAAPAASSRSSTGTSSPTWCCWRRRCPAATCRSARC